jgi:hypothetical protein
VSSETPRTRGRSVKAHAPPAVADVAAQAGRQRQSGLAVEPRHGRHVALAEPVVEEAGRQPRVGFRDAAERGQAHHAPGGLLGTQLHARAAGAGLEGRGDLEARARPGEEAAHGLLAAFLGRREAEQPGVLAALLAAFHALGALQAAGGGPRAAQVGALAADPLAQAALARALRLVGGLDGHGCGAGQEGEEEGSHVLRVDACAASRKGPFQL